MELHRQILIGDVLEKILEIPNESIDTVITSPPYWGLRDYRVKGQWGLEPNFHDYLDKMSVLMSELKRVLKSSGTCWINLGDTYSGGIAHSDWSCTDPSWQRKGQKFESELKKDHIEAKSRYGIPERFYTRCIDEGWLARNHIPWIKENAMPSSVKDRFSNKWESVFFFAKQQKYYFNLDAVREETISKQKPTKIKNTTGQTKLNESTESTKNVDFKKQDNVPSKNASMYKGFNDRWKNRKWKQDTHIGTLHERTKQARENGEDHDTALGNPKGKNPGDVFRINPRPFSEAHFATFPEELPMLIIRCACPDQVCKKCGKPRILKTKTIGYNETEDYMGQATKDYQKHKAQNPSDTKRRILKSMSKVVIPDGYLDCGCNVGFESGIVFDPFFGAGTVGVAAEKLDRKWCGIDIHPDYVKLARKRLEPYKSEKIC